MRNRILIIYFLLLAIFSPVISFQVTQRFLVNHQYWYHTQPSSATIWKRSQSSRPSFCSKYGIQMNSDDASISQDSASNVPVTIINSKPKANEPVAVKPPFITQCINFLRKNWLVLGEILVIFIAKMNPEFGATGGVLRPEITISKIGVCTIFFINGIALSLASSPSELPLTMKTNILIQLYNYGLIPILFKLFVRYYPEPSFR
jgi:hypothetical protein